MASNRPEKEFEAYWERVRPLGDLRCRVLACMSAHNPRVPAYFDPPAAGQLREALHDHLQRLYAQVESDAIGRLIVAAGLLTFGHLEMADVILQALPARPIPLDHGAGWCRLLPYRVLADLLPLPDELREPRQWVEGTSRAESLRFWFTQHRERLRWDAQAEQFTEVPEQSEEK